MTTIPAINRVFYGVICLAALLIAVLGLFMPAVLASMLAWVKLPPLHARFVGAIYGYGAVYTGACMLTRRWATARWALLLITVWTGMLGLISFLNLAAFDFSHLPVQVWFASYTLYPLIGIVLLAVQARRATAPDRGRALPGWASGFLWLQGALITLVAVLLFAAPVAVAAAWPWPVSTFLAQLYAGPLLAYGLCSLLCARQGTWEGIAAAAPAMLLFSAATLIASFVHSALFAAAEPIDWLWFLWFGAATGVLAVLVALQVRPAASARVVQPA